MSDNNNDNKGFVYLLCFDQHYHHAKHYVGFTKDIDKRMEKHLNGDGSCLVRAIIDDGKVFQITRIWTDKDRNFERKIKNQHNTKKFCPMCSGKIFIGKKGWAE